ncbi:MAG TPA: hypothetical protein DCE44_18830 [Verrucomicrobiales bacterium]|nr:hypothetical protein [Verrucomicrobiales bacterium]
MTPRAPDRSRPRGPSRAQRQVLAEWRRIDLTDEEIARRVGGRSVGQVLPEVLTGLRLEQKKSESNIVPLWAQIVDPLVATHAQPVGLHKGTLFVRVDSSVWLTEIVRYRRREILERLQHALGKETIKKISFRVG